MTRSPQRTVDSASERILGRFVSLGALRACVALCLLATTLTACARPQVILSPARPGTAATSLPSPTPVPVQTVVAPQPTTDQSSLVTAKADAGTATSVQSTANPTVAASPNSAATPSETASSVSPSANVPAEIDRLVADVPAHVGVVIARPDGSILYQSEAQTLFESASLYKLAIMVEVYRERDAGELSFDDLVTLYPGFFSEEDDVYSYDDNAYDQVSVATLMTNMITLSSNVAAYALLHLVGTDQVNATAAALGMTSTRILWYPSAISGWRFSDSVTSSRVPPLELVSATNERPSPTLSPAAVPQGSYNVTTPADVALLFEKLVAGTVISKATSDEMLDLLSHQEINDRLPAGVPLGTRVAHKTGDLDNTVHDAGVIYTPAGPVVVVVLSDQVEDRQAVVDLMRNLARLAYDGGTK